MILVLALLFTAGAMSALIGYGVVAIALWTLAILLCIEMFKREPWS